MQVYTVGFGKAKFDNNNLVDEQNIVNTWQSASNQPSHKSTCKCYFIPPQMLKKINESTLEQRNEQAQSVADLQEAAHQRFREARAIMVEQVQPNEPHNIFGFHNKSTQEQGESLQVVYDAKRSTNLPGKRIKQLKNSNDLDTKQAFEGGAATYVYLKNVFNRNSINNKGMLIKSTVNFGIDFNNAFWNALQMVYGKGDGLALHNLTHIDVVGHELGHGVTQYTANFDYQNQSGALNESVSDVLGSCVKQYTYKQSVEEADWKIGDGVVVAEGQCLRDMKNPGTAYDNAQLGKDPQPASMDAYDDTTEDNGGVHINSGIPNRAFYLVCNSLKGNSWDKAALIWYSTMSNRNVSKNKMFKDIEPLTPTTNFEQFATRTVLIAGKLYGKDSFEQKSVMYAWNDVKVKAHI